MVHVVERPQVYPEVVPEAQRPTRTVTVRDVLEQQGWCQGHYSNRHGNVCLVEAIFIALVPIKALRPWLTETLGMRPERWNDSPGRTYEEVLQVADRIDQWVAGQKQPERTEPAGLAFAGGSHAL
jgi:hypothetical protein